VGVWFQEGWRVVPGWGGGVRWLSGAEPSERSWGRARVTIVYERFEEFKFFENEFLVFKK
jgi:hypothetical protein